jgi:hypothetical protein
MSKLDLILELERRDLEIPEQYQNLLDEGRRRGLDGFGSAPQEGGLFDTAKSLFNTVNEFGLQPGQETYTPRQSDYLKPNELGLPSQPEPPTIEQKFRPEPPTIEQKFSDLEDVDFQEDFGVIRQDPEFEVPVIPNIAGGAETVMHIASGILGIVPASIHEGISPEEKERTLANWHEGVGKKLEEYYTYAPRTGKGKKGVELVGKLYDTFYRHPAYWAMEKGQKGVQFFTGDEPVVDAKGNVRKNLSDKEKAAAGLIIGTVETAPLLFPFLGRTGKAPQVPEWDYSGKFSRKVDGALRKAEPGGNATIQESISAIHIAEKIIEKSGKDIKRELGKGGLEHLQSRLEAMRKQYKVPSGKKSGLAKIREDVSNVILKSIASIKNKVRDMQAKPFRPDITLRIQPSRLTEGEVKQTKAYEGLRKSTKAVDETGEPIKLYHGTNKTFDEFEVESKSNVMYEEKFGGVFFTDDPGFAGSMATLGRVEEGANIRPAFLDMRNPLEVPYEDFKTQEQEVAIIKKAKAKGHDGIVAISTRYYPSKYVVFDKNQIKSIYDPSFSTKETGEIFKPPKETGEIFKPPKERRQPVETFDRNILNVQERIGYKVGIIGGDLADFIRLDGTRGETGYNVRKTLSIGRDPSKKNYLRTARGKSVTKTNLTRKIRTPGTNQWVQPLIENGIPMDEVFEILKAEGDLPQNIDMNDFLQMLREDLEGNPQYSEEAHQRISGNIEAKFDEEYRKLNNIKTPEEQLKKALARYPSVTDPSAEGMYRPSRGEVVDFIELEKKTFYNKKSQGPTRPGETLSTFPAWDQLSNLGNVVTKAYENLKSRIFPKPDRAVSESMSERPTQELQEWGINRFMSPSQVLKIFRELEPYFNYGIKTENINYRIQKGANKRFQAIDEILWHGVTGMERYTPKAREKFKEDNKITTELILMEDLRAKSFTTEELNEMNIPPYIQQAYQRKVAIKEMSIRLLNKHLRAFGEDPIERIPGYFPHTFGDWFIAVNDKLIRSAKTYDEGVKRVNQILKDDPTAKVELFPKSSEPIDELFQGKYKPTLGDLDYVITERKLGEKFSLDPETANEIANEMFKMKGRKRFLGHLLERKGVEGWDTDVDAVLRHYVNMVGRFVALDRFKKDVVELSQKEGWQIDEPQKGVRKYIKDYVDDIMGQPSAMEEWINNFGVMQPTGYIGRFVQGGRPAQRIASGVTATMAVTKLGFLNASAATVNYSQVGNTFAVLGPKFTKLGMEKAHLFDQGKMSKADERIVQQLGIREQIGLEHDLGTANVHDVGWLFNKSVILFQKVEQFNRRTAGLGSYYKFMKEHGVEIPNKGARHLAALEQAKHDIRRTQFDYTTYDAQNIIRRAGPVGSILGQFKKFGGKQAEFILGLKGAENPRFWYPYVLMVGLVGLPGSKLLYDTIEEIFGFDPVVEAQTYAAEWINKASSDGQKRARFTVVQTAFYGFPINLNANISGRVGINDVFPQGWRDLLGPAVSTLTRDAELIKELFDVGAQKGWWVRFLRNNVTTFGNLAAAFEGETRNREGELIAELSPMDKVIRGFGFQTATERLILDRKNMIGYDIRKKAKQRKRIVIRFKKAMDEDNRAEMDKIIDEYAESNLGDGSSLSDALKDHMSGVDMDSAERRFYGRGKLGKSRSLDAFEYGNYGENRYKVYGD